MWEKVREYINELDQEIERCVTWIECHLRIDKIHV